ncbi:hypothetical protein BT69DRAFT_817196 [Atractiella rhizophila]|nr:hypothetical protein BT69DRAFT_817196 [Atractiella rhizophila]
MSTPGSSASASASTSTSTQTATSLLRTVADPSLARYSTGSSTFDKLISPKPLNTRFSRNQRSSSKAGSLGLPPGKVLHISGPPASGKTKICKAFVRKELEQGGEVIVIESSAVYSKATFSSSKLKIYHLATAASILAFFYDSSAFARTVTLVIIDSLNIFLRSEVPPTPASDSDDDDDPHPKVRSKAQNGLPRTPPQLRTALHTELSRLLSDSLKRNPRLSIICTHNPVTKVDGDWRGFDPVSLAGLDSAETVKLILWRDAQGERMARVYAAPFDTQATEERFRITLDGIEDFLDDDELAYEELRKADEERERKRRKVE